MKKIIVVVQIVAAVVLLGMYFVKSYKDDLEMQNPKFYSGNGRLEATEVYISAKIAGRIEKVYVKEGDLVKPGDQLVKMNTDSLEADRAANVANVKVQEGELAMAKATVKAKQSVYDGALKEYERQKALIKTSAVSERSYENAETAFNKAEADLEYAKANVKAAEGKIDVYKAKIMSIDADLKDSILLATYDGRIQNLLAHEGEVLSAGGRALNLVNLTDAYMTFFLPTSVAGKLQMGSEVKLLFDAAPDYAFSAKVTFIDPVAQFTPKTVETKVEREKLMFRIKAGLNAELLKQYISNVKTGIPGVAWVQLDPEADWKSSPIQSSLPKD